MPELDGHLASLEAAGQARQGWPEKGGARAAGVSLFDG